MALTDTQETEARLAASYFVPFCEHIRSNTRNTPDCQEEITHLRNILSQKVGIPINDDEISAFAEECLRLDYGTQVTSFLNFVERNLPQEK